MCGRTGRTGISNDISLVDADIEELLLFGNNWTVRWWVATGFAPHEDTAKQARNLFGSDKHHKQDRDEFMRFKKSKQEKEKRQS